MPLMSLDRLLTWLPRIFLAVGLILLAVGAILFVLTLRFVSDAERAAGTVIDLSREEDSEGAVLFYPIVRFSTDSGRLIEFRSSSGSSSPPQQGESVDVLYDPDDPTDARLAGFFDLWLGPILFGFIGAANSSCSSIRSAPTAMSSTSPFCLAWPATIIRL